MYKYLKKILKNRLSSSSKSALRLPYRIAGSPRHTNRHLNMFKYETGVLKKAFVDFTPPIFGVKIVDSCNLRCPTCLYLLERSHEFVNNHISAADFHRVLNVYNKKQKAEVMFLGGGEPLMHPEFENLVNISKRHNLKVRTSTNGILLKDKISVMLNLDYVNVSLDAYDYESYGRYRGGTPRQFDMVMDGLKALKESGIRFSVSFLLSAENLSEWDKMISLSESVKPDFAVFHNVNPHNSEEYKPIVMQDERTKEFLDKAVKRYDYPFDIYLPAIFDTNSDVFHDAKCVQPWLYFLCDPSGNVAYCCHLDHDAGIGNVFKNYDYNSGMMMEFRKDIIRGKIRKSCLYCQRRFLGKEFGKFDAKKGKWNICD